MTAYLNQRFGDYRLTRLLGSGGFADVYEAEHLHLPDTKAAIKILKDSFSTRQLELLRKEAQIVSSLDHRSINGTPKAHCSHFLPSSPTSARLPTPCTTPISSTSSTATSNPPTSC